MKTSDLGVRAIQNEEGLARLRPDGMVEAYQDIVFVWTIGYGHTGPDVFKGKVITQAQALELLRQDLAKFEQGVTLALKRTATQHQFDAMVSLAFNIGLGRYADPSRGIKGKGFKGSTVLRMFNSGKRTDAAVAFILWSKAGGKFVGGLVERRARELVRFMGGYEA